MYNKKTKWLKRAKILSHVFSAISIMAVGVFALTYTTPVIDAAKTDSIGSLIEAVPEETFTIPDFAGEEPVEMLPEYTQHAVKARCGGDELLWLACGVYFEARNQSTEGQYWVAQSILNRVQDSRWPNTIEGVVRQGEERKHKCQYSFMCDGKPERIKNQAAWQTAVDIAVAAMEDYYEGGPVTCAHSYRATYVTNQKALTWFATLKRDEQVGTHIFFC